MNIEITYPSKAMLDRTISISFLVENNGWEDKQDVVFVFGSSNTIVPIQKNEIQIDKISAGGSYGETVDFKIAEDANVTEVTIRNRYKGLKELLNI